jgi:AraC-like DNA-binding protein
MAVEQAGREAALEPGDFTVVDWSRPARWATASERAVSLMFPQALLALPHDEVARLDREDEVAADTVQDALRRRVHAFIEQRLADPALSPAVIADAHHVSVRYLYKLFEGRHRGVAGWIRSRRLERSRRDLLDPALAARPVSAIAARWGWSTRPSSAASSGRPTAPRRWSTEGPWAGRPAPARCPCTDRQRPCARCQRPPQVPRRHWDRCHRSQGGAP